MECQVDDPESDLGQLRRLSRDKNCLGIIRHYPSQLGREVGFAIFVTTLEGLCC